ncbi:MAG: enoyl-CoA hydratase-related protein [Steroidobacteraceae bacterium]
MSLLRRREGNVEILTLNRPEQRNALNREVIGLLGQAFTETENDPAIRSVILTGAGDKAFCAGMDLKEFAQSQGAPQQPTPEYFMRFIEGRLVKPLIAAVNATALAGGFELMLNCDLVIASERALFGIPEAKRGLFAAGGGMFLPARIAPAIAFELGLTGDPIDAARAYQLGLVNRVVPADQVVPVALQLAQRIAENGPLGVAATKLLMSTCLSKGMEAARALMPQLMENVFKSEDAIEGSRAFAAKRQPRWQGK